MKKHLLIATALVGLSALHTASALTINATVGGSALAGVNYENFDDANLSAGLSIVFAGNAGYANLPDVPGAYAAPYASGNNNLYFGTPTVPGPDDSRYVTTGTSTVTLSFDSAQNYLGLLWGSIDTYNSLLFYTGVGGTGDLLATVTGAQALLPANGFQGQSGTAYVNITQIGDFQSVVFKSTQFAFEFDNVAYGKVPDGGSTVALFGAALLGLALVRRKRA